MKRKDKILAALMDDPVKKPYSNRTAATDGQTALIALMIDIMGGPAEFGKLFGIHRQVAVNWRNRGTIPLSHQRRIVDKMGIPSWLLDYNTARFYNPDIKPWIKLVKDCPFFKKYVPYLVGYTAP